MGMDLPSPPPRILVTSQDDIIGGLIQGIAWGIYQAPWQRGQQKPHIFLPMKYSTSLFPPLRRKFDLALVSHTKGLLVLYTARLELSSHRTNVGDPVWRQVM